MNISLTALVLCCLATPVFANPLKLVTGNNYPPFADETLPHGGMMTEIVELAFREAGYATSVAFRPWKRGYEETKKGLFAATFPYIKTTERLKDFYYSEPMNIMYTRIFVTRDSSFTKFEDLQNQRICIPLGFGITKRFAEVFTQNFIRAEGHPVDLVSCLKMMLAGRKDFVIINEITGWMTIQNTFQTKEGFRTLEQVFEEETHHLIVSKTYPDGEDIITQFNIGLKKLEDKGTLHAVIQRHLKGILD